MSVLLKIRATQAVEMTAYAMASATVADEMDHKASLVSAGSADAATELTARSLRVVADAYRVATRACFAELSRIIEDCK
jgi:hypothetical protein